MFWSKRPSSCKSTSTVPCPDKTGNSNNDFGITADNQVLLTKNTCSCQSRASLCSTTSDLQLRSKSSHGSNYRENRNKMNIRVNRRIIEGFKQCNQAEPEHCSELDIPKVLSPEEIPTFQLQPPRCSSGLDNIASRALSALATCISYVIPGLSTEEGVVKSKDNSPMNSKEVKDNLKVKEDDETVANGVGTEAEQKNESNEVQKEIGTRYEQETSKEQAKISEDEIDEYKNTDEMKNIKHSKHNEEEKYERSVKSQAEDSRYRNERTENKSKEIDEISQNILNERKIQNNFSSKLEKSEYDNEKERTQEISEVGGGMKDSKNEMIINETSSKALELDEKTENALNEMIENFKTETVEVDDEKFDELFEILKEELAELSCECKRGKELEVSQKNVRKSSTDIEVVEEKGNLIYYTMEEKNVPCADCITKGDLKKMFDEVEVLFKNRFCRCDEICRENKTRTILKTEHKEETYMASTQKTAQTNSEIQKSRESETEADLSVFYNKITERLDAIACNCKSRKNEEKNHSTHETIDENAQGNGGARRSLNENSPSEGIEEMETVSHDSHKNLVSDKKTKDNMETNFIKKGGKDDHENISVRKNEQNESSQKLDKTALIKDDAEVTNNIADDKTTSNVDENFGVTTDEVVMSYSSCVCPSLIKCHQKYERHHEKYNKKEKNSGNTLVDVSENIVGDPNDITEKIYEENGNFENDAGNLVEKQGDNENDRNNDENNFRNDLIDHFTDEEKIIDTQSFVHGDKIDNEKVVTSKNLTLLEKAALNPMELAELFSKPYVPGTHSADTATESFYSAECSEDKQSQVAQETKEAETQKCSCCIDEKIQAFEGLNISYGVFCDGQLPITTESNAKVAQVEVRKKESMTENKNKIKVRIKFNDDRYLDKQKDEDNLEKRINENESISNAQSKPLTDFKVRYETTDSEIVDEPKVVTDGNTIRIFIPL